MEHERRDIVLVAIAVIGAIVAFLIPMPYAAIPAAIALTIALAGLVTSHRGRD